MRNLSIDDWGRGLHKRNGYLHTSKEETDTEIFAASGRAGKASAIECRISKSNVFLSDVLCTIPPRVAENPAWRHVSHAPHSNKVYHSCKT
jgi:hypothetical protein